MQSHTVSKLNLTIVALTKIGNREIEKSKNEPSNGTKRIIVLIESRTNKCRVQRYTCK